jgi:hypothetical protein
MQTSDLVQRVHVCANTFRHQHSSIIKNSQIYIYIYQYFQDRCKLCPHCYQMSNPPKYRSLIPAVWVWKYGTGSVILPVKICQVPEQKNMGLSENRGFPQNPMVHHGLSISKIKTLGEFSTHFHPFSSIFITMVIFWGILKKKKCQCVDDQWWPNIMGRHTVRPAPASAPSPSQAVPLSTSGSTPAERPRPARRDRRQSAAPHRETGAAACRDLEECGNPM